MLGRIKLGRFIRFSLLMILLVGDVFEDVVVALLLKMMKKMDGFLCCFEVKMRRVMSHLEG